MIVNPAALEDVLTRACIDEDLVEAVLEVRYDAEQPKKQVWLLQLPNDVVCGISLAGPRCTTHYYPGLPAQSVSGFGGEPTTVVTDLMAVNTWLQTRRKAADARP